MQNLVRMIQSQTTMSIAQLGCQVNSTCVMQLRLRDFEDFLAQQRFYTETHKRRK